MMTNPEDERRERNKLLLVGDVGPDGKIRGWMNHEEAEKKIGVNIDFIPDSKREDYVINTGIQETRGMMEEGIQKRKRGRLHGTNYKPGQYDRIFGKKKEDEDSQDSKDQVE